MRRREASRQASGAAEDGPPSERADHGVEEALGRFAPGVIIGEKYRLEAKIGAGGMGMVFSAEHLLLKRPVALKVIPSATGSDRPLREARLLREARAAQALRSENVILVYDVGIEDGCAYIVMERLEGENLSELGSRRGPLPVSEAVDLVLQVCTGLAEAHAAGIIHRDIKPSNLFVTQRTGEPLLKILDFGISKTPFGDVIAGERTAENALLGSPAYMSPEQLRHASRVDARSDVWSLAVTLYVLLAGTHPFSGENFLDVSVAIATEPPRPLRSFAPRAPPALEEALAQALAKRPEDRTASVVAFAAALAPFASERGRALCARLQVEATRAQAVSATVVRIDEAVPSDPTVTDDGRRSHANAVKPPPGPAAGSPASPALPSRRRALVLATGGAAVAVALGAFVVSRRNARPRPAPIESPASAKLVPQPEPAPVAVPAPASPSTASSASEPVASPAASSAPPPGPRSQAPRPPRRSARTKPPAPALPPSEPKLPPAAPEPKPPARRLDIDGIPIIE